MNKELGRSMIELIGIDTLKKRNFISNFSEVWQVIGNVRTGIPELFEVGLRSQHFRRAAYERKSFAFQQRRRTKLIIQFLQFGFEIKQLEL